MQDLSRPSLGADFFSQLRALLSNGRVAGLEPSSQGGRSGCHAETSGLAAAWDLLFYYSRGSRSYSPCPPGSRGVTQERPTEALASSPLPRGRRAVVASVTGDTPQPQPLSCRLCSVRLADALWEWFPVSPLTLRDQPHVTGAHTTLSPQTPRPGLHPQGLRVLELGVRGGGGMHGTCCLADP